MHSEKRESFRCPVQESFASAILKVGRHQTLAQLLQESAGGFTLACDDPLPCQAGQVAVLQIASGLFEVQVVHLTDHEGKTRVGLRRLSSPTAPRGSARTGLFHSTGRAGNSKGAFSLILFALLGASLTLLATSDWFPWGPNVTATQATIGYQLPVRAPNGEFQRGLAGLNTLTSEEVVSRLSLSESQQNNIESIFRQSADSLAETHQQVGTDSSRWQQETGKLVEQATRRVVGTLTREQLQEWSKILHESAAQAEQE